MKVRHIVGIGILVLVAIAATFQVVDPRLTQASQSADVDFSDPPSDVVATSVTKLQHMDYSYEVVVSPTKPGTNESGRLLGRFRIEHSDTEYVRYGPRGANGTWAYANDAVAFVQPPNGGDWRVNMRHAYPLVEDELNPFNVTAIREANGTVVDETATQVVIRINATTTSGTDVPGYTLFYLDRQSGNLQKAVEVGRYEGKIGTARIRFSEVGTTTVERPDAIGFSAWELVGDLMRYTPAE